MFSLFCYRWPVRVRAEDENVGTNVRHAQVGDKILLAGLAINETSRLAWLAIKLQQGWR